ncbi:hypothetical protein ACOSQ2_017209 [Xanthoceras sorbifolium]
MKILHALAMILFLVLLFNGRETRGDYTGRLCLKGEPFPNCKDDACLAFCNKKYAKVIPPQGANGICLPLGCVCIYPC